MKTVSTSLDENTQKELSSIFENMYQALQSCAASFLELRKKALREIRGNFTTDELHALLDIHNATLFDPRIASMSGTLIASVEDANNLDGLCSKWGIDFNILIEKLKKLSDFQAFFLSFECYSFWYGSNSGNDLEGFIKRF